MIRSKVVELYFNVVFVIIFNFTQQLKIFFKRRYKLGKIENKISPQQSTAQQLSK